MGMAGAGLFSGTGDPLTLSGNPAGLGWLSTSVVGGDFSIQRAGSDTKFDTPDATTTGDRTVSDYRLGSFGGAYSFPTKRGSLVLGVSFHQSNTYGRGFDVTGRNSASSLTGTLLPGGFEVDGDDLVFDDPRSRIAYEAGAIDFSQTVFDNGNYPFFPAADPQDAAVDGQMVLQQRENVLESGQMNELSIGSAVEVAPRVMIGGGLNITFGSYEFERFYTETEPSALLPPQDPANPQPPYDPYFLAGTNLEGFYEYQLEERIDADLAGVNFRAGVSAKLTSGLRGGLLIESPTWFTITEVFGTQMRTDFDCDFGRSGSPCPTGGVSGFESGSLTGNEFDYELKTPWRIGAGLQYSQNGLTVAGDLEVVDWTQAEVTADDASFTALNREIQTLDATFNGRLGVEYAFSSVALRGGAAYRPDPRGTSFQDVDGQSTEGEHLFLSAGATYTPDDQFSLHVSWMQEHFDDQFRSYSAGPLVREALTRNQFLLGITYRL